MPSDGDQKGDDFCSFKDHPIEFDIIIYTAHQCRTPP